jgi:transcriptional regulator with XRE-family HTH domain
MTVGERLRKARKRLGLTQQEMADKLDCTQPTIADWETGRVLPRTQDIRAVADAYKLEPEQLLPEAA